MLVLSAGLGKVSVGIGRCFVWEVQERQPSTTVSYRLPSRVKGQGRHISQSHGLGKGLQIQQSVGLKAFTPV